MLEVTPQERQALIVLAVLIAGGAVARHLEARGDAREWLEFTAHAADTLNPKTSPALRDQAEAARTDDLIRREPLGEGERIDPNTAPEEQLDRLPRVGPALARRIIAHRDQNGPFRSLDDLAAVSGIGPALLDGIAPYIDLSRAPLGSFGTSASMGGGPDQVDLNRAGVEELQSLPGVGPVMAERIVAHRNEHGRFATFDDLEAVSGIGPSLRARIEAVARLGR